MTVMVTNAQNLLQNGWAVIPETGYVASGTMIVRLNDDPIMTLTYFMASLNFGNWHLSEKKYKQWIFRNYCSLRHETWQMQTTNEVNKSM